MSDIKVVVFDLGNVLIPFDYSIIQRKLNNIDAGLGDRFGKRYFDNIDVYKKYEKWEIKEKEYLDIMMEWSEHKVEREEFCHIYSKIFTVNKDVAALLPLLSKKYRLVLLSNTCYIHQKYGWEEYEFLKHFDKLILSHEVGSAKPEEAIYRAVEKFTKHKPEEHIFIDDVAEYAEGAKKCGWQGVQFTGYDKLVADLQKHGLSW